MVGCSSGKLVQHLGLKASTVSWMSLLVVDSSRLWLMPSSAAREQHGLRHDFVQLHRVVPRAAGHHGTRARPGVHGALQWCCRPGRWARQRRASILQSCSASPRRWAILASSSSTSVAIASRWASVGHAGPMKKAAPGTTLMEPLGTFKADGARQIAVFRSALLTYSASSATATAASRRRSMGVVPAWLAVPIISQR